MKNVCQTCVFDLEYGLPVAVRDHALSLKDDIPTGDFNKEHFHENLGKELALQGDDLRGAHSAPNAFLERLSGSFLQQRRLYVIRRHTQVKFWNIFSIHLCISSYTRK